MPFGDGFFRILVELLVARAGKDRHPIRFRTQHQVRAFGRNWKIGIDRRSERMHKLRPLRVPEPQRAAAFLAEISAPRALGDFPGRFVAQPRTVDGNVFSARDLQRLVPAAEINGIPAPARGLAAT